MAVVRGNTDAINATAIKDGQYLYDIETESLYMDKTNRNLVITKVLSGDILWGEVED